MTSRYRFGSWEQAGNPQPQLRPAAAQRLAAGGGKQAGQARRPRPTPRPAPGRGAPAAATGSSTGMPCLAMSSRMRLAALTITR